MLDQIHHIAFLVKDMEATIQRYETLLGMPVSERGKSLTRGGEIAIFKLKNINLELVSPTDKNGFLQQLLDEQGEGFFHIAFGVDDIEKAGKELEGKGIKMKPITVTYKDWEVAYLDKEATNGIYTHLIANDAD